MNGSTVSGCKGAAHDLVTSVMDGPSSRQRHPVPRRVDGPRASRTGGSRMWAVSFDHARPAERPGLQPARYEAGGFSRHLLDVFIILGN